MIDSDKPLQMGVQDTYSISTKTAVKKVGASERNTEGLSMQNYFLKTSFVKKQL